MIVDQFLLVMGNTELSVQVAAHGHRRVEDILQIAQSLEAVQEEEKFQPRGPKPANHASFTNRECDHLPDTKRLL